MSLEEQSKRIEKLEADVAGLTKVNSEMLDMLTNLQTFCMAMGEVLDKMEQQPKKKSIIQI